MGLRRALAIVRDQETLTAPYAGSDVTRRPTPAIASPWAAGQLESIVWADIYGSDAAWLPITRTVAMKVPAIARARTLLTSTLSRCPLNAWRADVELEDQPTWTYRTDGPVPPQARMLWTIDDVLFGGWSLWAVERDSEGFVSNAVRVPPRLWEFDSDGVVTVGGMVPDPTSIKLIGGPHEGILTFGANAIRAAADLELSAARYARNPVPVVELHETSEYALDDVEKAALRADWSAARRDPDGGVAFSNSAIEVKTHGAVPEHLLLEGRNASAVDAARLVGIPAAMVDATSAQSTLTYETVNGRQGQFLDYGVEAYADAIASWLSMDDVVPRGQRIAFDLSDLRTLTPAGSGPAVED